MGAPDKGPGCVVDEDGLDVWVQRREPIFHRGRTGRAAQRQPPAAQASKGRACQGFVILTDDHHHLGAATRQQTFQRPTGDRPSANLSPLLGEIAPHPFAPPCGDQNSRISHDLLFLGRNRLSRR